MQNSSDQLDDRSLIGQSGLDIRRRDGIAVARTSEVTPPRGFIALKLDAYGGKPLRNSDATDQLAAATDKSHR